MSAFTPRYAVRIVGPAGFERWLTERFKESDDVSRAAKFYYASNAGKFGSYYFDTPRGLCHWDVQDLDDPERGSIDWENEE